MNAQTLMFFLLVIYLPSLSCQSPSGQGPRFSAAALSAAVAADTGLAAQLHQVDTVLLTPHFRFIAHGRPDSALVRRYAEHAERARQEILAFTGYAADLPVLDEHLYASAELKGLVLKNSEAGQVDEVKNEAYAVLDVESQGQSVGVENELVLRRILGRPRLAALEHGLAVYFCPQWQGAGYAYWSAKLAASGNLLPLAELVDEETWAQGPVLQSRCLSASLVAFLLGRWGRVSFLEQYGTWQPDAAEVSALEPEWQRFMALQRPIETGNTGGTEPAYLKGFNFTHEGYQIFDGYGSRQADRALDQLKGYGTNAVSIVPYSFLRDPSRPAPFPLMLRPGSENDEAVIHTAQHAVRLGMAVVLKPQIWMGGGHWPGDIAMTSEEDWQSFFRFYNRWIVHYAMMAEIHHWDVLCIGTEMVKTTLLREQDWRRLIRQVRGVYSGKLVYAANWGEEFEKNKLWDALDYIGLNCYYPLSDRDEPSNRELERNFGKLLDRIGMVCGRYQKKLIFTEIGFPSVEAPWKKPHEDWGDLNFDAVGQHRCYDVVLRALQGKAWCQGILWWKCHSAPNTPHRRATDFTPFGKPAETSVRQWLSQQ